MLHLIFRQIRHRLGRVALIVLAIGTIIAEILMLEGFLAGTYAQLRSAVMNRGGDLMVTQKGIGNFIAARSILPQTSRLQVEAIPGVREAHPLTSLATIYDQDGRRTPIIILVYDTAGGPQQIIAGRGIETEREIVIDHALASRYRLELGDALDITGFEFTIAGISKNSAAFFTPFAFITFDGLIEYYFASDVASDIAAFPLLSFLSVETEPGADPGEVAARIRDGVAVADAFLPAEIASRDVNLGRELLGPILRLLLVVSYGIGALVVGMFMSAAVRSRRRSLGVMRALGFSARRLALAVVAEAVALTLLAIPAGILLARGLVLIVGEIAPVFLILPNQPEALLRTAAISVLFATLGALMPMRLILGLDPAAVFRS